MGLWKVLVWRSNCARCSGLRSMRVWSDNWIFQEKLEMLICKGNILISNYLHLIKRRHHTHTHTHTHTQSHTLLWGATEHVYKPDRDTHTRVIHCSEGQQSMSTSQMVLASGMCGNRHPPWVIFVSLLLLCGLHCYILLLPFYFCFIHSPCFLPVVSRGWHLMRLLWLVQEPNWVFNLVFRCRMSLSPSAESVTIAPLWHIKIPRLHSASWKERGPFLAFIPLSSYAGVR